MKKILGAFLVALLLVGFVTGCRPAVPGDTTAPTVSLVVPGSAVVGVAINAIVAATFDEPMDPASITSETFTLTGPGTTAVAGTVTLSSDGLVAAFTPTSNLAAGTVHTGTITTGAQDVAGNAVEADFVWSFTTGTTADSTRPEVISIVPANGAVGVASNGFVTATFSELMNPATITTATFKLTGPGATAVAGAVTMAAAGTAARFTPASDLAASTIYTATVTTGAEDIAGNALASKFEWTFSTGITPAVGPAPVVLGTAGTYVILAKSTVTTTGTTAIVGNVGLSPAAASFIVGFGLIADATNVFSTSSLVTGRLYAADYTPPTPINLTTAVSDMETAYTDAAGRTTPDHTELGAGDVSGLTLFPGLYKWGTGLLAATAFTISGGPNDIWIFQIAGDLTVENGVIVTLSGGAQPKNIFWQVGGQVTLGTTSDFKGIILCQTQIAMNTGAVLLGRALAQTAVTLDANAVTQPAE